MAEKLSFSSHFLAHLHLSACGYLGSASLCRSTASIILRRLSIVSFCPCSTQEQNFTLACAFYIIPMPSEGLRPTMAKYGYIKAYQTHRLLGFNFTHYKVIRNFQQRTSAVRKLHHSHAAHAWHSTAHWHFRSFIFFWKFHNCSFCSQQHRSY